MTSVDGHRLQAIWGIPVFALVLALCGIMLALGSQPVQGKPAPQACNTGRVFVGNMVVDFTWQANAIYNYHELYRGPTRIWARETTPGEVVFVRDTGLTKGTAYEYRHCYFEDVGDPEPTYCCTETITAGQVGGTLLLDLIWSGGEYELAGSVEVAPGATLRIQSNAVITGPGLGIEDADFGPPLGYEPGYGTIVADGAVFGQEVWLYNQNSSVQNCTVGPPLGKVVALTDTVLMGNTFISQALSIQGDGIHGVPPPGSVEVVDNDFYDGYISQSWGETDTNIHDNRFYASRIELDFDGTATIHSNDFWGESHIDSEGNGTLTIEDNEFRELTDDAVRLRGGSSATVQRNTIVCVPGCMNCRGFYINSSAYPTRTLYLHDNIVARCNEGILMGSSTRGATITRNKIVGNHHGIEIGDEMDPAIYDNCIAGNQDGLYVYGFDGSIDATYNYWGSPTGPTYSGPYSGENLDALGDHIQNDLYGTGLLDVLYTPWLTASNCMTQDLSVAAYEVVQSVQTLDNAVGLVAGKPAMLRLYPNNIEGSAPAGCQVTAYRDGVALTPQLSAAGAATPIYDLDDLREDSGAGCLFELPLDWLTGTLDLRMEVNASGQVAEVSDKDNVMTHTATFDVVPTVQVLLAPVFYEIGSGFTGRAIPPDMGRVLAWLTMAKAMYPVVEFQLDYRPWAVNTGLNLATVVGRDQKLWWELRRIGRLVEAVELTPHMTLAVARAGFLEHGIAETQPFHPVGSLGMALTEDDDNLLHDMGHLLGLQHPGTADACGATNDCSPVYWPYLDATIQEYGYATNVGEVVDHTWYDAMTYCDTKWISPFHYGRALATLRTLGTTTQKRSTDAATTYLLVSGTVGKDGTVAFAPTWRVDLTEPPPNPPWGSGSYCLELRGYGGGVFRSHCFDPEFTQDDADSDWASFLVYFLPVTPTEIVLRQGDTDLGTYPVSSAAPEVHVTAPGGKQVATGDTVTVQWTATDTDGDDLEINLYYSADGGTTWLPFAAGLSGVTSHEVDLLSLPASDNARFRVEVNDGFFEAHDESDSGFVVPDGGPLVGISSPADDQAIVPPLSLLGYAYDAEDGLLDAGALTWTSDQDGALGSGFALEDIALSPGQHILTLSATDSGSNTRSESVTVTVYSAAQAISGLQISNSSPAAPGEPVLLEASVQAGTNVTYTWDLDNGQTGSDTYAIGWYETEGIYTATVTATNNLGWVMGATRVTIAAEQTWSLYLPLLMRNQ